MVEALSEFAMSTGFASLGWQHLVMITISLILMYLAIEKKFEPMLLLPISFGMLLANLPATGLTAPPADGTPGGLLYYLSFGAETGLYPLLVFFGVGAMTDFGPLLANPSTMLLGCDRQ